MVSIPISVDEKSHSLNDVVHWYLPDPSARHDGDPKPLYECSRPTRPEWEQLVAVKRKTSEHTVKTQRILSRSDFQWAIRSLSLFTWTSWEGIFHLPFSETFSWISAIVLRLRESVRKSSEMCVTSLTHVVNCVIASRTGGLRSRVLFLFIPRQRALHTSAQASPRST